MAGSQPSPELLAELCTIIRAEFASAMGSIRTGASKEETVDNKEDANPTSTPVPCDAPSSIQEAVRAEFATGLEQIQRLMQEQAWCPSGRPQRCQKTRVDSATFEEKEVPATEGVTEEDNEDGSDSSSWGEDEDQEPRKLIICVRCDLGMSIGKTAAQVGHAVHKAVRHSTLQDLQAWESCGSKKVTLKVDSESHLLEVKKAARDAGIIAESIRDAGHTELEPGTMTVLAVGPALESEINSVTGQLRPVPDTLKRENEKLKAKCTKTESELDAVRKEKKQIRQEKLNLLKILQASRDTI